MSQKEKSKKLFKIFRKFLKFFQKECLKNIPNSISKYWQTIMQCQNVKI